MRNKEEEDGYTYRGELEELVGSLWTAEVQMLDHSLVRQRKGCPARELEGLQTWKG